MSHWDDYRRLRQRGRLEEADALFDDVFYEIQEKPQETEKYQYTSDPDGEGEHLPSEWVRRWERESEVGL